MSWSRAARAAGQADVAGAQALEDALEDGVVVDAGLEPVDAVRDDVGLDGVEGAGGRRRAQGVARLHGAHPGARPQQRGELLQRERLAAEVPRAAAPGQGLPEVGPRRRRLGQLDSLGLRIRLERLGLVQPVQPPAAQAPAAVPGLAEEALADAALSGGAPSACSGPSFTDGLLLGRRAGYSHRRPPRTRGPSRVRRATPTRPGVYDARSDGINRRRDRTATP